MLQLSSLQKQSLLEIARQSVEARLLDRPAPRTDDRVEFPQVPCGVFVSIHSNGRLRGCIGCIESDRTLPAATAECAASAASTDPRFPPVQIEELGDARFEVSVLSPPQPIASVEAIEVGRHGILIERPPRRGLLLPQVAVAHEWDRVEFLRQTLFKAGLEDRAWSDGAQVSVFEALVFGEGEL